MNRPGADGTRESGKIVLVEATPSGRGPEEQLGYDAAAGHWSVRESDTILLAACKTLGIPSKRDRRATKLRMHPTLLLEGCQQVAAAAFLHKIRRSQS